MSSLLPVIAIVGRPNVGKSTLFNRLLGQRVAIVSDIPGTTRDRLVGRAVWDRRAVLLVDTGGLEARPTEGLEAKVRQQVDVAVEEADLVLLLVDAAAGLHPSDQEAAQLLRRNGKPLLLVVNKADGKLEGTAPAEFYALGLGDPTPVSALHNLGIGDLKEQLLARFPAGPEAPSEGTTLKLAIVGRPNVGKSSLLNALAGEERAIVHEEPGTTRDTIDTAITYRGHRVTLLDTAGMRRRGRVQPGIEQYSVLRVLQAVERCNVAVLVLDATELVTAQDTHVAGLLVDAYKGMVIAVNKWDLAPSLGLTVDVALQLVRRSFDWASYVPVCFVSARSGAGLGELMAAAWHVFEERQKRVPQEALDQVLQEALARRPPTSHPAHALRVYRLLQVEVDPPTFVFFVNQPKWVHFSYRRLLENSLRRAFGFEGSHLRLLFKKSGTSRRASA